jgi:hypothetical protein
MSPTRRSDTPYLITAGGLLAVALAMEDLIAQSHGVSPLQIHEHTVVPYTTHGLAFLSMAAALWPRVQDIRESPAGSSVRLQAVANGVVVVTALLGQVMVATIAAFSSLAISILQRAQKNEKRETLR